MAKKSAEAVETPFLTIDVKDSPKRIHDRLMSLTSTQGSREAEMCYVLYSMQDVDPITQEPRWLALSDGKGMRLYDSWKEYVSSGIDVNDKKAAAYINAWGSAEIVGVVPDDFGSDDPLIWRRFRELVTYIRRGDISEVNAEEWLKECRKSSVYRIADLAALLASNFKKDVPDPDGLVSFRVKMTPAELNSTLTVLERAKEKFETEGGGAAVAKVFDEWHHIATGGGALVSNAVTLDNMATLIFEKFGVRVLFLSAGHGGTDVSAWRLFRGFNKDTRAIENVIATTEADARTVLDPSLSVDEEVIRSVVMPDVAAVMDSLPPVTESTSAMIKLHISSGKLTVIDVIAIMRTAAAQYPAPKDLERFDATVSAAVITAAGTHKLKRP